MPSVRFNHWYPNAIRARYAENSGRWIVTNGNKTKRYERVHTSYERDAARVVGLFIADFDLVVDGAQVAVTGATLGKDYCFVIHPIKL